jgi:hypothetical protein
MESTIDVKFRRIDRTYRFNEKFDGVVQINAVKGWSHQGVNMVIEGLIFLSHTYRGLVGLRDTGNRPITFVKTELKVAPAGKVPEGITDIPFEFTLSPVPGYQLHESYHGVCVSIVYNAYVLCERGVMKRALQRDVEFIVEIPSKNMAEALADPAPINFKITPESLTDNTTKLSIANIPKFLITGKLHRTKCPIHQPLTGEVIVEVSEAPIRSIDLQLIRCEYVDYENRVTNDASEVQMIQIADGNICRNFSIPIYAVFPRLFACANVTTAQNFKINFELNLIISFTNGYVITENFPLFLYRDVTNNN